ncbi:hypothetical protein D3C76_1510270 [compost metagenome]
MPSSASFSPSSTLRRARPYWPVSLAQSVCPRGMKVPVRRALAVVRSPLTAAMIGPHPSGAKSAAWKNVPQPSSTEARKLNW